ncbi:DUF5677 domain-containing protein [Plebeiibacterium sediminum]|uniref:DUF5677 domain-containing protein n=1 Tax=Plebeiibacterium sediminum TaxID=2992112 RepID=A0AAE3M553_9BACT|nr:DUF5677 domain-containing protein [Plebeiobacterium sediminum]MCW3787387.1 DUF5677 domain-containing protein [Plebeiobacterium sediminum]
MNEEEKIQAILNEANSLNLESLYESLDVILKAHGDIVQSIYETKPELGTGEVYIETLIIKLIYASKSALQLSLGSELSTLNHPEIRETIDRPSLYVLTRSIIETFLTLEYLFFNELSRDEQIFRYNLWRISGFMTRQNFSENLNPLFADKLYREKKEIEKLKTEIRKSPFYKTLKKQEWKLDRFGLPRILSWSNLILESKLKSNLFSKVYSLYSNYAHSEFISIIQINESKLGKYDPFNISTAITSLNKIRLINCVTIILLVNKFECAKEAYQKLDENLIFKIEFWNKFATE